LKIIPDLIQTWEDYDEERKRRLVNIENIEWRLRNARMNLYDWGAQVVEHLRVTIGERNKK